MYSGKVIDFTRLRSSKICLFFWYFISLQITNSLKSQKINHDSQSMLFIGIKLTTKKTLIFCYSCRVCPMFSFLEFKFHFWVKIGSEWTIRFLVLNLPNSVIVPEHMAYEKNLTICQFVITDRNRQTQMKIDRFVRSFVVWLCSAMYILEMVSNLEQLRKPIPQIRVHFWENIFSNFTKFS